MVEERLWAMQDSAYRAFMSRLIPQVDTQTIVGVRTPQLRTLARELAGRPETSAWMDMLPHRLFEENQLHIFLIERERDFDACMELIHKFLPFVDNWATCDQLAPKALGRDIPRLMRQIPVWLGSEHPYTVRFGVNCLMRYGLGDAFEERHLAWVAELPQEDYYVRMGAAWYFATALALQYDAALSYIQARRLPSWTHNKAIQKAIESRRIPPERKDVLRALRV